MNISHWIEHWAISMPGKTALRFEGQSWSYADFDREVRKRAQMLRGGLGVSPGDRIVYLGQNHPESLFLVFACARLGAIYVPLNWRLAPVEHEHMLQDSGATVLFVDEPYQEQCLPFTGTLTGCSFVAVTGEPGEHWLELDDLLQEAGGEDSFPGVTMETPLLLIYTSGTTGKPKGALLSQEAVQYNAYNSVSLHALNSDDIILTVLPLFHVGGLNNQTSAGFYAGAEVILHRVFDPAQLFEALVEGATQTVIVPAHMPPLQAQPGWETTEFPGLRCVLTGSTAIPDEMTRHWHNRGIPLVQMYGATETCPIAIHTTPGNAMDYEGCIGFPAMHCEIRIVNDEGEDCVPGQAGEIWIRGKNVMLRYWNNEEATAESLTDGWYHSGDIASMDERGCYHFHDRKKDVIISGAENIYPAEVENVLNDHPGVLEVAVVGRADERWGEVAIAAVVTNNGGPLAIQELADWLQGKLGRYKHPKDYIFMDKLPRNEMRKVQKHVLREMLTDLAN